MAMEQARAYLKQYHKEQDILVLDASSATVEQAAQALGTQPERIAKSLSFMVREHAVIVVAAGDCRVDNHAYKETFGCKAKMLKGDEVEAYTNHAIGGVCPFGVPANTRIYLDVSLKRFDFVYPAWRYTEFRNQADHCGAGDTASAGLMGGCVQGSLG